MSKKKRTALVSKGCVACGCCVKSCRRGAMEIHKGLYCVPNKEMCVGCGKCAEACPAELITVCDMEVAG